MSIRQIDEALRLWHERLNAAAQNLIDLQAHPVYKRISSPETKLAGETARQAALAIQSLSWLLQYFDALQSTIKRAEDARQNMPTLFGIEEREREIAFFLNGRSVQLPPVNVPIAQRSLLAGMENATSVTPADLLRTMEAAFDHVKGVVLSLDAAWESVGRSLESACARLQAFREIASHLDNGDQAALAKADDTVRRVQTLACDDPLGASLDLLPEVHRTLDALSAKLDRIAKQRLRLRTEIENAQALLRQAQQHYTAGIDLCHQAREKTAFGGELNRDSLTGLATWLDKLQSAAATAGPTEAVFLGLQNWKNAAEQILATQTAVTREARNSLDLRSELRGRLDALKAKARAYAVSEQDNLASLADHARKLLYTRPTPLEQAAGVVGEYEAALNIEAAKNVRK